MILDFFYCTYIGVVVWYTLLSGAAARTILVCLSLEESSFIIHHINVLYLYLHWYPS